MLRLRGGGKKRKKKTYTKPKKVKHVHKAVKLAVLKFYRVDDNGKVQRLRKSCPNEECGVGVRMAVHKDRFYCGKCGLTVSACRRRVGVFLSSLLSSGLVWCRLDSSTLPIASDVPLPWVSLTLTVLCSLVPYPRSHS